MGTAKKMQLSLTINSNKMTLIMFFKLWTPAADTCVEYLLEYLWVFYRISLLWWSQNFQNLCSVLRESELQFERDFPHTFLCELFVQQACLILLQISPSPHWVCNIVHFVSSQAMSVSVKQGLPRYTSKAARKLPWSTMTSNLPDCL